MRRQFSFLLLAGFLASNLCAQRVFTWQELRDRLTATNPTLEAGQINIDESRAAEITAYLRPNPGFQSDGGWVSSVPEFWSLASAERRGGNTRLQLSARAASTSGNCGGTAPRRPPTSPNRSRADCSEPAVQLADRVRANVAGQGGAALGAAKTWPITKRCFKSAATVCRAGDIAQVDLDRLELQRVQYETDVKDRTGESADREDSAAAATAMTGRRWISSTSRARTISPSKSRRWRNSAASLWTRGPI